MGHLDRDPTRPVYVISVAASIVSAHPRTLRIYEDEGLLCPARTATNIRLYSEEDVRRILWIRHLTQNRGVNLAGVRVLFELEERLGMRILETLFDEANAQDNVGAQAEAPAEARAATGTNGSSTPTHPTNPSGHLPADRQVQSVGDSSAGEQSTAGYRDQRTTDLRRRQGEPGNGQ
jgi:MerR family transcriptional regulator, heat shock protein HspR